MFAPYVGLPFVAGGRSRAGCDCWGLVRLVYADRLGITLPSFNGLYAGPEDADAMRALVAGARPDWHPVPAGQEEPLDVVEMHNLGVPHIGVVVRRGFLLHTEQGSAAVIEPYATGPLRRRIRGFFRHGTRACA